MNALLADILRYTLPGLIIFLTVYFLFRQYFDNQFRLKMVELRDQQNKNALPLKLQAYERMALLFERISMPSLVLRLQTPGMQTQELQGLMLITVQQEFEHNLAQQIYISQPLWKLLRTAKEESQKIISLLGSEIDPKAPATLLAERLLDWYESNSATNPTTTALDAIRTEANLYV